MAFRVALPINQQCPLSAGDEGEKKMGYLLIAIATTITVYGLFQAIKTFISTDNEKQWERERRQRHFVIENGVREYHHQSRRVAK